MRATLLVLLPASPFISPHGHGMFALRNIEVSPAGEPKVPDCVSHSKKCQKAAPKCSTPQWTRAHVPVGFATLHAVSILHRQDPGFTESCPERPPQRLGTSCHPFGVLSMKGEDMEESEGALKRNAQHLGPGSSLDRRLARQLPRPQFSSSPSLGMMTTATLKTLPVL